MRQGYWCQWDVLNAADFGVPQTRRRLILRALRGGLLPVLPLPQRWVGWYEAIEDLIPVLPESYFAEWQLKRLGQLQQTSFVEVKQTIRPCTVRGEREPAPTVTGDWMRYPVSTPKAFLLDGKNIHPGERVTSREAQEPSFGVTASTVRLRSPLTLSEVEGSILDRPCHGPKAFIVADQNGSFTISATAGHHPGRAWLSQGRVVAMTPRALARFQTFDDTYKLPDSKTLACRIIGNAVPRVMAQKLVRTTISS